MSDDLHCAGLLTAEPQQFRLWSDLRYHARRSRIRRLIAFHEAGHAAAALALWIGHQDEVTIEPCEGTGAMGYHAIGGQINLDILPGRHALAEIVRRAIVGLAGPMVQATVMSQEFDLVAFLNDPEAGIEGSDAAGVVALMSEAARRLDRPGEESAIAARVAAATSDLLGDPGVEDLVHAIAEALVRRGRVGEEGLGRLHDRHPTDAAWVRLPARVAAGLASG